jgi:hypothetical protein
MINGFNCFCLVLDVGTFVYHIDIYCYCIGNLCRCVRETQYVSLKTGFESYTEYGVTIQSLDLSLLDIGEVEKILSAFIALVKYYETILTYSEKRLGVLALKVKVAYDTKQYIGFICYFLIS